MAIGQNDPFRVSNKTRNINSQCKIVVYPWNTEVPNDSLSDQELSESSRLDISSQIIDCTYNKTMGQASGSFSITLSNSPNLRGSSGDWKDIIKRGHWLVIYMSQDGDLALNPNVGPPLSQAQKVQEAKKIRCIGFVDRVVPNNAVDDKGAFDITYSVEGRDFGVIYEDTNVWHNLFQFDRLQLDSLANNELNITGATKLDRAMSIIHDLFFNPSNLPGANVNDNKSLTSVALQWLLPRPMVQDVFPSSSVGSSTFWGELGGNTDFQPTEAGLAVEKPTDFLTGNAWSQLRKASVPEFHELFTETDDNGVPRLIFRPIPLAFDKSKYPTVGKSITLYKDLPAITISSEEVIETKLAEDNHNRYNSFLAMVSTSLYNTEDNISVLQSSGFPEFQQASIKRYGFRPMHVSVDSIIKNAAKNGGKSDRKILIEFNELLKDYWNNAIFLSSGPAEHIGNNSIKIGKALVYGDGVPYEARKRYYIEGYADTFVVDEKGAALWTQSLTLTRGAEEEDLKGGGSFAERNTRFTQEGEYTQSGGKKR